MQDFTDRLHHKSDYEKSAFKAKKCRMIGIWPSGTVNGEWSNLAKSFIDECLMERYIYVDYKSAEKKREEDDSHEVDVFCCCQNNTFSMIIFNVFLLIKDLVVK